MVENMLLDSAATQVHKSITKNVGERALASLAPLLEKMQAAWQKGQPFFTEDLLVEHPEVRESPEALLRLLAEEITQRRQAGHQVTTAEVIHRFPQWPKQIKEMMANLPHPAHPAHPAHPSPEPFEAATAMSKKHAELAARLADEMSQRWHAGERPAAEEFLQRHPELNEAAEAAIQVIYEEVCLRQEHGQTVSPEEIFNRFPQWQAQLQILLDCHRLLEEPAALELPSVHETLGEFFLLSELGQGAQGRVFLARHKALADRMMVLKVTPCTGQEHLSLARLQHTHIVPLYAVENWPARQLRALVFPYLGHVTWKQLQEQLAQEPLEQRRGRHLLEILDRAEDPKMLAQAQDSPTRRLLAQESYVQAVCRLGACLAETLHYAHERGLVHLDVKPTNVLLAADGQPLLLDFHLAQPPLEARGPLPESLGGTPGYMAPEQERALAAAKVGRPIPLRVDGRADLYALGIVLYEALSGKPWQRLEKPAVLWRVNPQVSVGLSDIIHKCLAECASDRYASGASLAEDLRRHLDNRPLRGVPNRSLGERWRKWRRRRPYVLPVTALALALFMAVATVGLLWINQRQERLDAAEKLLRDGQALMSQHRYGDAVRSLARGQELMAEQAPASALAQALAAHARIAQRAAQAQQIHAQVDQLRFFYVVDTLPPRMLYILEASGRQAWEERARLVERQQAPLEMDVEDNLKKDLLDLAICLADFRVRLRKGAEADAARREALVLLEEAEAFFGPSAALYQERERYARELGLKELAQKAAQQAAAHPAHSAWDHLAIGRGLMRACAFAQAARELDLALAHQPDHFWANFCRGACAQKMDRHEEAVQAFSVCIGRMPQIPECYLQRGKSHAALGHDDQAQWDYARALERRPNDAQAETVLRHQPATELYQHLQKKKS